MGVGASVRHLFVEMLDRVLRVYGGWRNDFFDDFKKCCPNFGDKYPINDGTGVYWH